MIELFILSIMTFVMVSYLKYKANTSDIETIEKALQYVVSSELNFIFTDRDFINKTLIVSFDSDNVYIWRRESENYVLTTHSHQLKMDEIEQHWWACGPVFKGLHTLIPKNFIANISSPFISGSLVEPFIGTQRLRNVPNNPYTTLESYYTTIIHEFAHAYYNNLVNCSFWNQEYNLNLIEKAENFSNQLKHNIDLKLPVDRRLSELFAYCADRASAKIFFPKHARDLEKYDAALLKIYKSEEINRDKFWDLSPIENTHKFALIHGQILLKTCQKSWVEKILKTKEIYL